MYDLQMNKQLGTKWFTFYTKVRPVLSLFTGLSLIGDFLQYKDVYFQYWWMVLYFMAGVAQTVLSIVVALKSDRDYPSFVKFVKGVLIFETINMSYQQGVQQYTQSTFNFGYSLLIALILLIIMYFVWYRLNMKYFTKRLMLATDAENVTEPNGEEKIDLPTTTSKTDDCAQNNENTITENIVEDNAQQSFVTVQYCRKCGNKLSQDSQYCCRCGTKIIDSK